MEQLKKIISNIPHEIKIIRPLKKGLISEIYLCNFNNIKSVIRLDLETPDWIKIQRDSEIRILDLNNNHKSEKNILYHDLEKGILIRRFIEGNKFNLNKINSDQQLELLGKAVKEIHKTNYEKDAVNNFSNAINRYKEILKYKIQKDPILEIGFEKYQDLNHESDPKVFSHNDLTQENIIWDHEYVFIDWEYAGLNNPLFDIASIISSFSLNDQQINSLWRGYGKKSEVDMEILRKWVEFTYFCDYIWRICLIETSIYDEKSLNLDDLKKNLSIFL
ncbi:phosphotransferase [Gammaproteobacteria bacterium]|nr:phosphotransferase [Gammaproteobacteria bacterium]